jgi:Ca-activated chloride channel family protein
MTPLRVAYVLRVFPKLSETFIVGELAELRRRGVATTTFGIGADFDERLLRAMSIAGGGNFYFIAHPNQIGDFLTSELGEALEIVARDVRIVIEAPADLTVDSLTPVTEKQAHGGIRSFGLPDLVSNQEIDALFHLNFPVGSEGAEVGARVHVTTGDGENSTEPLEMRWTYADDRANEAQPRDRTVDRKVAAIYAALARQEALLLNRDGRYEEARSQLMSVGNRIRSFEGDDPILRDMARLVIQEASDVVAPMAPAERKGRYFASSAELYSRDPSGRARKKVDKEPPA